MNKISANIKELTEIKDDLENTLKTWDSLLNVLESDDDSGKFLLTDDETYTLI